MTKFNRVWRYLSPARAILRGLLFGSSSLCPECVVVVLGSFVVVASLFVVTTILHLLWIPLSRYVFFFLPYNDYNQTIISC